MAFQRVILLSFNKSEVLKVFQKSLDNTRMLEKGFPDVLSCNRSLKRALSRLSEILKFGYCQKIAWASIHVPILGNFTWASSSSLERAFMCSSLVCSLKHGLARLSEHSSWQTCKNYIFKQKSPEFMFSTHAYQPGNIYNIVVTIHGNKQHNLDGFNQKGKLKNLIHS